MFSQKFKQAIVTTVAAGALSLGLGSAPAHAIILGWNFNLSTANTLATSVFGNATSLDHLDVNGTSTVVQHFDGAGSANAQPFTDTGSLDILTYRDTSNNLKVITGLGATFTLSLDFTALTGFAYTTTPPCNGSAGCVVFTPGSGTVKLILTNTVTSTDYDLADYTVASPSGGTFPNFFGGSGPNGTVDVSLIETGENAGLTGALFTDAANNPLAMALTIHLINTNALCVAPVPCVPGGPFPEDFAFTVQNEGQYKLDTALPEPGTLSMLGLGLLGLAFGARRRQTTQAK